MIVVYCQRLPACLLIEANGTAPMLRCRHLLKRGKRHAIPAAHVPITVAALTTWLQPVTPTTVLVELTGRQPEQAPATLLASLVVAHGDIPLDDHSTQFFPDITLIAMGAAQPAGLGTTVASAERASSKGSVLKPPSPVVQRAHTAGLVAAFASIGFADTLRHEVTFLRGGLHAPGQLTLSPGSYVVNSTAKRRASHRLWYIPEGFPSAR